MPATVLAAVSEAAQVLAFTDLILRGIDEMSFSPSVISKTQMHHVTDGMSRLIGNIFSFLAVYKIMVCFTIDDILNLLKYGLSS